MNDIGMHQCGNINCLSQQKESVDKPTFTRIIYQVDARKICQLLKQNKNKCLYKTFSQLLYLASIDQQENNHLLLPDLICIAIHWNPSQCITSEVEDLVSIIDPFICLQELFSDVTRNDNDIKQVNLIGLICFYGTNIEVFFSYEYSTSKWLFCFDGNFMIVNEWNDVKRKCIDFHLQPFLLIYGNSYKNSIDITQLLKRTLIQAKTIPSMTQQKKVEFKNDLYSLENLSKISSFATLNSSMLFMPSNSSSSSSSNSSYINQEIVAKVMQQQLLKKELLSSSFNHIQQKYDDTLSSGDSSTSSQRDSGLSSGINDGSSDNSLTENEQTEYIMHNNHFDMSLASIEYYLEQSLKYESSSNYSYALEYCQRALLLLNQIINLNTKSNTNLSIYTRTRKNSLLLRIRSLKKRKIQYEELNSNLISSFKSSENVQKKNKNSIISILSSTKQLSRPKKNVKFSDSVALIVPTSDDTKESSSEHLIHSFLRNIHHQQTTSDSDSDSPSSSSLNDIPIGLNECSLCHKRYLKNTQLEIYCSNCHFYMQRFRRVDS